MSKQSGAGSEMVLALESAYADIRGHHAELPPVVILVGDGQRRGQRVNGSFAEGRWISTRGEAHELVVASQRLRDGAVEVLETLLHEAAHALCTARGVQDTSRGGRYHNTRYRDAAEEVGLLVRQGEHGWHLTDTSDATERVYAATINRLRRALRMHVDWAAVVEPKKRQSQQRAECSCGRIIRASASVLEEAPIICGECGQPFLSPVDALPAGVSRQAADDALAADDIVRALRKRAGPRERKDYGPPPF